MWPACGRSQGASRFAGDIEAPVSVVAEAVQDVGCGKGPGLKLAGYILQDLQGVTL